MSRFAHVLLWVAAIGLSSRVSTPAVADELPAAARRALSDEAVTHVNKARSLYELARFDEAAKSYRASLAIHRRLHPRESEPQGHAEIAQDLLGLGIILIQTGELQEALAILEEALAMCRQLYPTSSHPEGHPDLALSHVRVGFAFLHLRLHEKALPHGEQGLAMYQRLFPPEQYPDGRRELAAALEILGSIYAGLGNRMKARDLQNQVLEMNRRLYPASRFPNGHLELVRSSLAQANFHVNDKTIDTARSYFEQALQMAQKLLPTSTHPDGHPLLAHTLHRLALLHLRHREMEKAADFMEQTLAMQRRLMPRSRFPDGTLEIVRVIHNCGSIQRQQGFSEKALPYFEEAVLMLLRLTNREVRIASEDDGLEFVKILEWHRNVYLTAAIEVPDSAAASYDVVWSTKAAQTRVLEHRQASARAAAVQSAAQLTRLTELRRLIDQTMRDPTLSGANRDAMLTNLSDERDRLERVLAPKLPILAQWGKREKLTQRDLVQALPPGSAFVDILSYKHAYRDPTTKKRQDVPRMVAFILSPGAPVQRVELGDAGPIQLAIARWRKAIEQNKDERLAAAQVRTLVWEKIATHLSPGTTTLYVSPDRELSLIPWGALPGSKPGAVLLEEFTGGIAVVPHGPALLESLYFPRRYLGPESTLIVGGVNYGNSPWLMLAGTQKEVAVLEQLVVGRSVTLTDGLPSVPRLTEELKSCRYAHLSTHGFFAEQELARERSRAGEMRRNLAQQGGQAGPRLSAANHPLGFNGLVLTGGEILSGLGIIDLPLDNLKLVTLSACESGLGELTGGEGTFGLVRAFHLAGVPNVVASLWKVDDAATAALMAKFYYELWVRQRPPLAALREAQLTILRNPELIPALAGERGPPKLKEAAAFSEPRPAPGAEVEPRGADAPRSGRRAATRLWAAFVLSGVGI